MKYHIRRISLVVAIMIAAISILPVVAKADISQAAVLFLEIPMDVRGRAMGDVGVALPNLAFAVDINPALLTDAEYATAGYSWGDWLPTLADDLRIKALYAGVGEKLLPGALALGFGYKRLNLGEQIRVDEFGNIVGTFETWEWAATFGAAIRIGRNVSIGASLKRIVSHLSDLGAGQERGSGEASTWAVDGGIYIGGILPATTYTGQEDRDASSSYPWAKWTAMRRNGFGFGVAVRNIGGEVSYIAAAQADPLPRVLDLGVSYRPVSTFDFDVLLVGEVSTDLLDSRQNGIPGPFAEERDYIYHWGAELGLLRLIDVRIGHVYDDQGEVYPWTWGMGIGIDRFRINFSKAVQEYTPLDGTFILSVTAQW